MVHRKRSKDTRMRGKGTHGWGDKKKRRSFGHRGGKGLAGRYTGAKKPGFWPLGRKHNIGFVPMNVSEHNAINIGDVNLMIEKNRFPKKGSVYEANLTELGFTKLLSKGKLNHPVSIIIESATEKAVKKTAAAGGSIAAKQ